MNTTAETSNSTTILLLNNMQIPMFSINILFGLPLHSYVLWLIVTGTGSGVATEYISLNHSFCEIGISVDYLMFVLSNYISHFLPIALLLQGLSITGRPLFECLICVERYLAVVHPVTFLKFKPLRYRLICCSVVWIITVGSCFVCQIMFLLLRSITLHSWFFSVQFLLYLPIQLFCLVAVLRALKQSGPGERKREEENHMKRRAFYIILITTITMTITYVPSIITGIYTFLSHEYQVILWLPSMFCYVLAGFVQPVLYLHRTGKLFCLCSS